jgi:lipopolysaccharide/colanic/teichoic acid biosynthesis glycosyltransferase
MQLVIIHKGNHTSHSKDNGLLWFALSSPPISGAIIEGLAKWPSPTCKPSRTLIMLPKDWGYENVVKGNQIIPYVDNVSILPLQAVRKAGRQGWICVSNGRFVTKIAPELIEKILTVVQADLVAVNVTSQLKAYNEKAQMAGQGNLVGFRRLYSDSFEPAPLPGDWPHCLFVRTDCFEQVLNGPGLPRSFPDLLDRCKSVSLRIVSVKVGGEVLDLETESGLLDFCGTILGLVTPISHKETAKKSIAGTQRCQGVPDLNNPLFFGRVLLGKNVRISPKAVIIGPTIIGDNVKVEDGAIITSSLIGPNVLVPAEKVVQNRVLKRSESNSAGTANRTRACDCIQNLLRNHNVISHESQNGTFRVWPRFSYARFFKRIVDIAVAGITILLFVPFFLVIAVAIKLSSSGPLFFKDKRQGLHGKEFNCIKFRTMIVGADDMQDKMRALNQVDGPQFKIDDDPRVNNVGRFMRATYIDEVPQFINVLLGQMSVVGPRPSPESENESCPFWRYARLSVRPGITGLWQVFGTREPLKDFQEWIHYDVKYVEKLSLKLDLWICYKTVRKMIKLFIQQL